MKTMLKFWLTTAFNTWLKVPIWAARNVLFKQFQKQNSEKLCCSAKEVDEKLHGIMNNIHDSCVKYGAEKGGYINYVKGANIAGFIKVADAMIAQGIAY